MSAFFFFDLMHKGPVTRVPVGVVDLDNSSTSRALSRNLGAMQNVEIKCHFANFQEACDAVQRMMRFEPQIAENYIKYLSERILFLNRKLYLLSSGTAEQRLASFLLDNLPLGQAAELPMPLSKLSLALNVSRASLYRAFDALTESGAVVKEGRKVCINDAERLKKI